MYISKIKLNSSGESGEVKKTSYRLGYSHGPKASSEKWGSQSLLFSMLFSRISTRAPKHSLKALEPYSASGLTAHERKNHGLLTAMLGRSLWG